MARSQHHTPAWCRTAQPACSPPLHTRALLIPKRLALRRLQALVQKFELIAARSAMLGFAATILFELDGTRIVALGPSEGEMFAASSLLAMAASASLALARNRRAGGGLLLEGVLSSLTCVGRSASSLTSITPASLDASVDLVSGQTVACVLTCLTSI